MKCHPSHVSVPLPPSSVVSRPIFSGSHELVSQRTTEQQAIIPDLPNSEWLHTPLTRQDSSAGAIINNKISLGIAQLGLSPISSLILNHNFTTSGNNTAITEIGYWGSALLGFELGFLRLDSAALTTGLQIHCSSSYSPRPQIKYPTHKAHPAGILISPSLVTAVDTIHMIFPTHALFFFVSGYWPYSHQIRSTPCPHFRHPLDR